MLAMSAKVMLAAYGKPHEAFCLGGIRHPRRIAMARRGSYNMTPEQRIESFTRTSATILAQLEELRALHEQIRQAQEAILERQQVQKKIRPRQN
jgi:hypothetical protein